MPTKNEPPRFAASLAAQIENGRTWLLLVLLVFNTRLLWLFQNRHELDFGEVSIGDWARFFFASLRFDVITMTYLMLPCLLFAALLVFSPGLLIRFRKVRTLWVAMLFFAIPIIAFANAIYYHTFGNVFDDFIFEFFDGNASDVFANAYNEHGLVAKALLSCVFGSLALGLYQKYINLPIEISSKWRGFFSKSLPKVGCSIVIILTIVLCLRGGIGTSPLQRSDAGVTAFRVLNLGALNPIYNLKSAWRARVKSANYFDEKRIVLPEVLESHVVQVTGMEPQRHFSNEFNASSFLSPAWQRIAVGPPNVKPSHVFMLFLESYDSWPFLEEYRELGLVEQGRQLGKEGHLLKTFLPGANSSVKSSLVCLQGLFQTNRGKQECLPTSLVHSLKQLGYQTRSINSFSSQWCGTERIALEQGFDEIYCTANIKPGGDTYNLQVHDRTLFEFAADQLDYDRPTFSFIRTSSYHPPYEVDLKSEDCEIAPFPDHIRNEDMLDEKTLRNIYGHLKYTDKMTGEFVRTMIKRYPDSLFVITGDHYGRRFLMPERPVYEGSSVPLILYGPQVLENTSIPENMAASHVDLVSTLVELCAPKGFQYTSIGKSVLAPCDNPVGIGEQYVIFPRAVVSLRSPPRCDPLPWLDGLSFSEAEANKTIEQAREIYAAYHGVSYMMARRSLEKKTVTMIAAEAPSRVLR